MPLTGKPIFLGVGAVVFGCFFFAIVTPYLSHRGTAEIATTYHRLNACYDYAIIMQQDTGSDANIELFRKPEVPPYVAFLNVLESYTKNHGGTFNTNIILDGWGRPLLFTNDLGPTGFVRIWSAGPNGRNEDGRGDDIGHNGERPHFPK